MRRPSAFALAREALRRHRGWERAWASPPLLRRRHEVVVVGGGGHGLAAARYPGRNQGTADVAVLKKAWLGDGNAGRNTTIIRSNDLQDASAAIHEKSRRLFETLSQALNHDVMFSPRSVLMPARPHGEARGDRRTSQPTRPRASRRPWWGPILELGGPRCPVVGALWQPRGGTARHHAVAWGCARACSGIGVAIVERCEVTGVRVSNGRAMAVEATRGPVGCDRLVVCVAGPSGVLAETAWFRLPVEGVALQALVSEPLNPCLDGVVMANTVHGDMSQSDKGERVIGGGGDGFGNCIPRGSFHSVEETVRALVETFPMPSRLKRLRQGGGIVERTGDRSPIISRTPVENLFLDRGWGTGGFKAILGGG